MDLAESMQMLRAALDYVQARIVAAEALCERLGSVRVVVDAASRELAELEARSEEVSLDQLSAILDRVTEVQDEWEEVAEGFSAVWQPTGGFH